MAATPSSRWPASAQTEAIVDVNASLNLTRKESRRKFAQMAEEQGENAEIRSLYDDVTKRHITTKRRVTVQDVTFAEGRQPEDPGKSRRFRVIASLVGAMEKFLMDFSPPSHPPISSAEFQQMWETYADPQTQMISRDQVVAFLRDFRDWTGLKLSRDDQYKILSKCLSAPIASGMNAQSFLTFFMNLLRYTNLRATNTLQQLSTMTSMSSDDEDKRNKRLRFRQTDDESSAKSEPEGTSTSTVRSLRSSSSPPLAEAPLPLSDDEHIMMSDGDSASLGAKTSSKLAAREKKEKKGERERERERERKEKEREKREARQRKRDSSTSRKRSQSKEGTKDAVKNSVAATSVQEPGEQEVADSKQRLQESVVKIWSTPLGSLPFHTDFPRLLNRFAVHCADTGAKLYEEAGGRNAVTTITGALNFLASQCAHALGDEGSKKMAEWLPGALSPLEKDQTDIAARLREIFVVPDLVDCPLVRFLKCIHQDMIFPAVYALRFLLYEKLPYKDVKGQWSVAVGIGKSHCFVSHTKREQSHSADNWFSFEWKLTIRFSGLVQNPVASLLVTDYDFNDTTSLECRRALPILLKPFLDPGIAYTKLWNKDISALNVTDTLLSTNWLVLSSSSKELLFPCSEEDGANEYEVVVNFLIFLCHHFSNFTLLERVELFKRTNTITDSSLAVQALLKLEGLNNSHIGGLLKCMCHEIMFLAMIDVRERIYNDFPFKDIKHTWRVLIELGADGLTVRHTKRHCSHDCSDANRFEFQWQLEIGFDFAASPLETRKPPSGANLLHGSPVSSPRNTGSTMSLSPKIFIQDYFFSSQMPRERREAILKAFKPFLTQNSHEAITAQLSASEVIDAIIVSLSHLPASQRLVEHPDFLSHSVDALSLLTLLDRCLAYLPARVPPIQIAIRTDPLDWKADGVGSPRASSPTADGKRRSIKYRHSLMNLGGDAFSRIQTPTDPGATSSPPFAHSSSSPDSMASPSAASLPHSASSSTSATPRPHRTSSSCTTSLGRANSPTATPTVPTMPVHNIVGSGSGSNSGGSNSGGSNSLVRKNSDNMLKPRSGSRLSWSMGASAFPTRGSSNTAVARAQSPPQQSSPYKGPPQRVASTTRIPRALQRSNSSGENPSERTGIRVSASSLAALVSPRQDVQSPAERRFFSRPPRK